MAQLDSQIPWQALTKQNWVTPAQSFAEAMPVANYFKNQRDERQMADIFGQNAGVDENGNPIMNEQNAIAQLYAKQPINALEFQKVMDARNKGANSRYQQFIDNEGFLRSYNYHTGTNELSLDANGKPIKARESFAPVVGDNGVYSF